MIIDIHLLKKSNFNAIVSTQIHHGEHYLPFIPLFELYLQQPQPGCHHIISDTRIMPFCLWPLIQICLTWFCFQPIPIATVTTGNPNGPSSLWVIQCNHFCWTYPPALINWKLFHIIQTKAGNKGWLSAKFSAPFTLIELTPALKVSHAQILQIRWSECLRLHTLQVYNPSLMICLHLLIPVRTLNKASNGKYCWHGYPYTSMPYVYMSVQ